MRIAVDVLGGDHAPDEILLGVADALRDDFRAEDLLLVGPEAVIRKQLGAAGISADQIPEILPTEVVIEGHEKPVIALRAKPDASILKCVGAVRQGLAQGLIAFGNTGAAVAASTMGLGQLPGIRRPGIAVTLTGQSGPFVLLDCGANPTPKALHLFQYGLMGEAYARDVLGIAAPRISLLNIGGEAGKGGPVLKEAHQLLDDSDFNFVGNIEGNHIFFGEADVIVVDGFAGNLVLKTIEGFAEYFAVMAARSGGGNTSGGESSEAAAEDNSARAKERLRSMLRQLFGAADFAEVGGASLLGLKGTVMIGHGRSHASAVLPALRTARADIEKGVNRHITESVAAHSALASPASDQA